MVDEVKDVNTPEETSPLEDVIASSPEAKEATTQETEPSTPQKEETPEETTPTEEERIPYSRFKEKVDETNWYKQAFEKSQEMLRTNQPQQQPQTQPQEPYAGMDAESQRFLQQRDARARQIFKEEVAKTLTPQIDAAKQEFARLQYQSFRKDHPEVKPNSPEEIEIAQIMTQFKVPLEQAYKLATYDKKVVSNASVSDAKNKQRLAAKKQANVTSPQSNSPASVAPAGETYEQEIERTIKAAVKDGEMED